MMLERLNSVNDVKIYSVNDPIFSKYGRIIDGFGFTPWIKYMLKNTPIPESGNIYVPSDGGLEKSEIFKDVESVIYGGMPIQAGYCNGRNSTYNGFEYHKCSEINIAVTDFVLVLGLTSQITDNKFYVGNEKVFYIPQGTAIEMYQTTLHLSPCRVSDDGFKDIVVLARGTNTPLEAKKQIGAESELLLQKNKWVIAHRDREPLIKQGAYPGLIGENKEIKY